ncbi:DUF4258 domain-containing protein [Ulvibacterium sp.]|uniref:DUF4258 domain-containing protein n=1 Tax=Ulvibacterium sp. TaxID=2665914 RepID=UPI00262BAB13|nr:DUF4258 domain-containing protein [Ulvibacterium sp.]
MPFLKRLGFYLLGLSVGLVFLTFFLKKKTDGTGAEFCYFPNCRTLKDIRSKPISYSEEINELLISRALDSMDIDYFLNDGNVDFEKSDTKAEPCKVYFIEGIAKGKNAILRVRNCRDEAILENVLF